MFVGGGKSLSTEELLSLVECDSPHDGGRATFEYLQNYLGELDDKGIHIASSLGPLQCFMLKCRRVWYTFTCDLNKTVMV